MSVYHQLTTSTQERKLKGDLAEVTEKYGEMCHDKGTLEDEIILLKDSSVNKEDHNKVSVTPQLFFPNWHLSFEVQVRLDLRLIYLPKQGSNNLYNFIGFIHILKPSAAFDLDNL